MRLLKLTAEGFDLFSGRIEFDFFAEQRVSADHGELLFHPFGSTYTNNVLAVVGINASGKTSLLKLISFVIDMLNCESINNITNKDILNSSENVFITAYFYDEKKGICKLYTQISKSREKGMDERYVILDEVLWAKKVSQIKTKKDLFLFNDKDRILVRNSDEAFLKDDISIVISLTKSEGFYMRDLIRWTNINLLGLLGDFPHELIAFLDPSIEKIEYRKKTGEVILKFFGREKILVSDPVLLEKYLSSGTIKGINVFINAMLVFEKGGYLIIDELENHFNREIVATLVRFFMNSHVNKKGATIVFSTHYSELLDEIERNDSIYIVRNRGGIFVQKLNHILKRNDIKKSEAFKSDYLEGTVPTYDSYMKLKNAIIDGKIREGKK